MILNELLPTANLNIFSLARPIFFDDNCQLQPLTTTLHFVEGFALVMLCNCRSYPRKLAVMILKEVKNLMKALGLPETDPPLIDVIDKCCPQVFLS